MRVIAVVKQRFFVGMIAFVGLMSMPELSYGQGEIKDAEFVIEKEKQIELPVKNRIFRPVDRVSFDRKVDIDFSLPPINFDLPEFTPEIDVSYREIEPRDEYASNHYLKASFGSLIAPYLLYNYQSQTFNPYGGTFEHESYRNGPVRDELSGVSQTGIQLWGKFNTGLSAARADMSFYRKSFYFYGLTDSLFNSENPLFFTDRVHQNHFRTKVDYRGLSKDGKWNYQVDGRFGFLNQVAEETFNKESTVSISGVGGYDIQSNLQVRLRSRFTNAAAESGASDIDRSFLTLNPYLKWQKSNFDIKAGLLYFGIANPDREGSSYLTTDIKVNYGLKNFNIYAGLDGQLQENTLAQVTEKNFFLNDSLNLQSTVNTLRFYGGISGFLLQGLYYDVKASYSNWDNPYFFLNDSLDNSRFNLVYDSNMQQVSVEGAMGYRLSRNTDLRFEVAVFEYITEDQAEAWHLPTFRTKIEGKQRFLEDFVFTASLLSLSGIKSFSFDNQEVTNISSILDLSFQLSYSINQQGNVFLAFENALNRANGLYQNYPVRPSMLSLGLSYRL
jgi:hypothetical protein